jgi:hypothetical protein
MAESNIVPVSAHYVDAPAELKYEDVPHNGKTAFVTGASWGGKRARGPRCGGRSVPARPPRDAATAVR